VKAGQSKLAAELIPKMLEIAKTNGFVFVYQKPDGNFEALTNLDPPEQALHMLRRIVNREDEAN